MRSIPVLSLVAVLAFSARAQVAPPAVDSIDPASGPVTGGTIVTITGRNFDTPADCRRPLICGPLVVFGIEQGEHCCITGFARTISASDTRLVIETPPHLTGATDVIVIGRSGLYTTVEDGFRFGRAGYRRVLVPVAHRGELPGAFGSRWVTELAGRARFGSEVTRTPFADPPNRFVDAFTFTDLPSRSGGMFLYIKEGSKVDLALRVRDVSRQDDDFGTEVPLVASEDTRRDLTLLGIPVAPRYRQTLRVYAFEGRTGGTIEVGVRSRIGNATDRNIASHRIHLPVEEGMQEFPLLPGYAEIDLRTILPPGHEGLVDLEVRGGFWTWAMVSVTNNETQRVTMITPAFEENGLGASIPSP